MPIRWPHNSPIRSDGTVDPASVRDHFEAVRKGQYESAWTRINAAAVATFRHELDEIPWFVDVISSAYSDGSGAVSANASVTVTKTAEVVTVTSSATDNLFFRVRAY